MAAKSGVLVGGPGMAHKWTAQVISKNTKALHSRNGILTGILQSGPLGHLFFLFRWFSAAIFTALIGSFKTFFGTGTHP
jgi:hypothetical protein